MFRAMGQEIISSHRTFWLLFFFKKQDKTITNWFILSMSCLDMAFVWKAHGFSQPPRSDPPNPQTALRGHHSGSEDDRKPFLQCLRGDLPFGVLSPKKPRYQAVQAPAPQKNTKQSIIAIYIHILRAYSRHF